jgi:hypothetical protein
MIAMRSFKGVLVVQMGHAIHANPDLYLSIIRIMLQDYRASLAAVCLPIVYHAELQLIIRIHTLIILILLI